MVNLSDQELVTHYLNTGQHRYFGQIYTRHRYEVYKRCLLYTGNKDDSEDFVQDIFMRLVLKLNSYKREAQFTTWLYAITTNYCFDQIRKQQKDRIFGHAYANELASDSDWITLPGQSHGWAFEQVLRQLSADQRELLLSKYKVGTQIKDIALSHDLSPSAVKMRLKRAREYARSLYDKILSEEDYL